MRPLNDDMKKNNIIAVVVLCERTFSTKTCRAHVQWHVVLVKP